MALTRRWLALGLAGAAASLAAAQVNTFAGNAQHTGLYNSAPALTLNKIHYTAPIDLNTNGAFGHYGMPLVTSNNVVIVPVKTSTDGFQIQAYGGTGYTLTTDYILPPHNWIPVYQPVLAKGPSNQTRLYYAGAGGTVYFVDNPDGTPTAPVQLNFYTDAATYAANKSGFDSSVYIDTPLTADSNGNIFFGFRVNGTAPAPLSTSQSGYARIDASGNATYVLANAAANDPQISKDCHNTAPALSNDEQTIYVVAKWGTNAYYGYLLGLDSTTLATKYKVFLWDPRKNGNPAGILDDGTASPMVAPDGDVYLGTFANPYNGSRGFLQHFSSDLSVEKTPGGFGWDYTPAIVPASMVPSYTGSSSYLLFCKYNNYNLNDGNGINTLAILDPNATQLDSHPSAPGLVEMREVLKVIGPTPDSEYPTTPGAVREWCINAALVNPQTNSIFFDSEDGHLYRWNTALNCLSESVQLTPGIGEPYVPTTMGPDGTVYSLNGGQMFALGALDGNTTIKITSSSPDMRNNVSGDSITFTATVSSPNSPAPDGTFTFTDTTYDGLTQVSNVIASNVPVDSNGSASVTTSSLTAGGTFLGNHFITATYSGNPAPGEITMVQKVHAFASSTSVAGPSTVSYGTSNTFTATVVSGGPVPTGYVTFKNGSAILGQMPLDSNGQASIQANLPLGSQTVSAYYNADTYCAASTGSAAVAVTAATSTSLSAQPNPVLYGDNLTLTAAVSSTAGTPTGSVTFSEGSTTLGTAAVDSNGVATLVVSSLTVGSHSLAATFTGTNGYLQSSGSATVDVANRSTSTVVTSSRNPSVVDQSVTLTATVTSPNGTPVGAVTFMDGSTTLANVTVNGSGVATFTTSALTVGGHSISALFAGNPGWANSSASLSQTVNADTSAPTVPTGVGAAAGPAKGQITLSWSASSDPDDAVAYYEVWRSTKLASGYSLIASPNATSYVDTPGRGQTRYYYIVAVDSHGNKSAASTKVSGKGL